MSLIIATWTGAIATVVLAVGAGVTIYYAKRAFDKQSEEVHDQAEMLRVQSEQLREQQQLNTKQTQVLELQAEELRASIEQRQADAEERRRAQATRVFLWEERRDHEPRGDQATLSARGQRPQGTIEARVKNASEQPIYDVLIRWHRGTARWGEGNLLRPVLPGEGAAAMRELPADLPPDVDPLLFGAVAYFRDAAGHRWRANPDGRLDELPDASLDQRDQPPIS